jgi:hypothetical protein
MTDAWFNHCESLEEAKAEYRRLCFMYHPDHGGDHEVMQTINRAYAAFKRNFKPRTPRSSVASATPPRWSTPVQPRPHSHVRRWTSPPPPPPTPEPAQRAGHPRAYVRGLWDRMPWHALNEGRFIRRMWGHAATLVPYPPNSNEGTWVVFVDGDLSPYMFYSREEAEQGAFEVIYDKVKYRPM